MDRDQHAGFIAPITSGIEVRARVELTDLALA